MAARFPELSEDELSTGKKLREYKKATKTAVRVFRQYLRAGKINEDDAIAIFLRNKVCV